jgi:hypothetical protein
MFLGTKHAEMKATIQKRIPMPGIFSASGLEFMDEQLYIIGDDSPWLYLLDYEGSLLSKHKLFDSPHLLKIPKAEKEDLESLTSLVFEGKEWLFTLGSGSKKHTRNKGFLIEKNSFEILELDLSGVFSDLRQCRDIVGTNRLNIEGLTATSDELVLFVRGNVSKKNVTLSYPLNNFLAHLLYQEKLKAPFLKDYDLPSISGWLSGFSGATYSKEKDCFLFTSSVEVTNDEINDGATLGSFVGIIDRAAEGKLIGCAPIIENDEYYTGKVESIAIVKEAADMFHAFAVTDADGGESELIQIEIKY